MDAVLEITDFGLKTKTRKGTVTIRVLGKKFTLLGSKYKCVDDAVWMESLGNPDYNECSDDPYKDYWLNEITKHLLASLEFHDIFNAIKHERLLQLTACSK